MARTRTLLLATIIACVVAIVVAAATARVAEKLPRPIWALAFSPPAARISPYMEFYLVEPFDAQGVTTARLARFESDSDHPLPLALENAPFVPVMRNSTVVETHAIPAGAGAFAPTTIYGSGVMEFERIVPRWRAALRR